MVTPQLSVIEGGLQKKTRGPILSIGVTAKEDGFARAVVLDGLNMSDAYRGSHCAEGMSTATVWGPGLPPPPADERDLAIVAACRNDARAAIVQLLGRDSEGSLVLHRHCRAPPALRGHQALGLLLFQPGGHLVQAPADAVGTDAPAPFRGPQRGRKPGRCPRPPSSSAVVKPAGMGMGDLTGAGPPGECEFGVNGSGSVSALHMGR
jgi:hypothetical protein